MLVRDDFLEELAGGINLGVRVGLLHHHHGGGNQRALAHNRGRVLRQRVQQRQRILQSDNELNDTWEERLKI